MKRLFKRVLPLVLSAAMLPLSGVGVSVSAMNDADGVFLNIPFNDLATNETVVEGLTISGGDARVAQTTARNKSLHMRDAESDTKIIAAVDTNDEKNVTYSFDLKPGKTAVNLKIAMAGNATGDGATEFLVISDNAIKTTTNKYVGSITGDTNLAFMIRDKYLFNVYVNGKCVLSKWQTPMEISVKSVVVTQPAGYDSYIDNIRIYKGSNTNPLRKFSETSINPDVKEVIGMSSDAGDRTYFDNRYCVTTGGVGKYQDVSLNPKTNKITANRLINIKDPHRTDEMHFEKNDTVNDCFMDVSTSRSNYGYKYYKMEGDFKIDKLGTTIQFPMIRETDANGYKGTAYPFQITADGSITFTGGSAAKAITEGQWFHFLAYFDTQNNKASAWLNGKQIAKDVSFTKDIEKISVMRISLAAGEGDLWLDNCNITALAKPFTEDGVEVKTATLPSEEPLEEYLSDKIAYGAYGNILVVDGEKIELEKKGEYDADNVKFYVPADTIARAFKLELTSGNSKIEGDITVTADGNVTLKDGTKFKLTDKVIDRDGELLVPFEELGEKVSGLKAWTMETGIIIFADHELQFDAAKDYSFPVFRDLRDYNDIDFITSYLNYVHPDEERLRADYSAKFGSVESTQHPRLILDADDFAEHKKHFDARDDEYYNLISDRIMKLAENYLTTFATYTYADPVRGSFYGFQGAFKALGYAWQMTGDRKYVDAAVKQFEIICHDMPDFNEAHALDAGQAMIGVAIGFDWLYDGFTPEQRDKYAQMIYDKGINRMAECLFGRVTHGAMGFDTARYGTYKNNINGIINTGFEMACIATMEYDPENCLQKLAASIRSIEGPLTLLAPAGGWVESPSYWDYMMTSVVYGTAAIEKAFGTDYGLMDGQGASTTVQSMLACFGNGIGNNYGDNNINGLQSFTAFPYFARRNGDRAAAYSRKRDVMKRGDAAINYNDLVFYDFASSDANGSDMTKLGNMVKASGVELVTIRDTFDFDTSQSFFSAHFGTTSGYHQHNDCGTFVLEMMGESWVEDLGGDDYNLQNVQGYKEWQLYRYRAEGHSVLIVNPEGHTTEHQMVQGKVAPIIATDANEHGGYVYADMDDVYNEASKMTMGYYLDDDMNSMTMRSEYTLNNNYNVYWVFQTSADATVVGNTVYLMKNGKTMKVEFSSTTGDGEWTVTDAKPFDFSPTCPDQNPNIGYKRVALKLGGKRGDNTLVVKMSNSSITTKPMQNKTFSQWTLPESGAPAGEVFDTSFTAYADGSAVGSSPVPVLDGKMPKITVKPNNANAVIEIAEATTPDEKSTIVVSSPDKSVCSILVVSYNGMRSDTVSVDGYYDLPIYETKVSSTPEVANHKDNIIDYDFTTRWTCMAKGEYAIFDLGSVKTVDGVAAAFWKGNVRSYFYDIYVSTDGANWTAMKTGLASDGKSEELNTTVFAAPTQARYIKLVGQGNTETSASGNNTNVLEFRALSKIK